MMERASDSPNEALETAESIAEGAGLPTLRALGDVRPAARDSAPLSETRRIAVAFVVASAFLMQGIDSTFLTTAIPTIARDLVINPLTLHLAVSAYLFSLAVFMPVSGWFADRFGARRVFCASLVVFTLGSVLCGLSSSLGTLVAARCLQGLGGAMMTPVGRLIVLRTFPGRTLDAMTYLTLPVVLGPLLGPLLGAFILTVSSWQWIFFVNVPICAIAIAATIGLIPRDGEVGRPHFDVVGFLIAGAALVLFQLGIEHLSHPIFGGRGTFLLFGASVVVAIAYVTHARRQRHPALDLTLFRERAFSVGVIGGGLSRTGLNASAFLLPLMLQIGFGLSPLRAAAYTSVAAFGSLGLKAFQKRLLSAYGFRPILIGLGLIGSAMMAGFMFIGSALPFAILIPYVIILGAVRAMQFNAVNALTYADIAPARLSRGVSSAGVFQQLSMGLGISLSATVLSTLVPLGASPTIGDFGYAFLVMAVLPVLAVPFFMTLAVGDGTGLAGPRPVRP